MVGSYIGRPQYRPQDTILSGDTPKSIPCFGIPPYGYELKSPLPFLMERALNGFL